MGHVVRRPGWGVIDLNTETGDVFVQEDWQYVWLVQPGVIAWTLRERRAFHRTADAHIWRRWSNRRQVVTSGSHHFAARFPRVRVNFDIRWVTRPGHWTVHVTKIRPGAASPRSYVDFAARAIHLDSLDLIPHRVGNDAGVSRPGFRTVPHEFGHTLPDRRGSASPIDDEYDTGDPHLGDTDSLMNIGQQVRARHLTAVLDELNTMLHGCTFAAL
ncbi:MULTISPECIES: hypothetical protein [Sorangium]|uniref:Uncharacterized protein n=1 Tax=Sorangium cellulosum (strain So ce56) TaxID=448385 RepID=A9EVY5_SORC5|nr:hypothetical protein [Sorangium cellulosum]CAN94269.1 hypothetical protein predicted by Glimmer/Critica [Sorangium cellulosum So ce56]